LPSSSESISKKILKIIPPTYDFQKTHCFVFLGNTESEIDNSKKILKKNGFPSPVQALPEKPDWRTLDSLYLKKDMSDFSVREKQLYEQVVSMSILRNHALLAEPNEFEKIKFYTDKYASSFGSSSGLLYYCIKKLEGHLDYSEKERYINAVTKQSEATLDKLSEGIEIVRSKIKSTHSTTPEMDSTRLVVQDRIALKIEEERTFLSQLKGMLR
jgi:hypothetical protein